MFSRNSWGVYRNLIELEGIFELPVLIVGALVLVATQLGAVVRVLALYVEHLLEVISVHHFVAVDAPELLAIAHLKLARV